MRTKHPRSPTGGPTSHPTSDLIASYATATLAIGPAVVVGAHLAGCASCRASASAFEEVEAGRMLSLEDTALRPGALQDIMDRLDGPLPVQASRTDLALALLDGIRLPEKFWETLSKEPLLRVRLIWLLGRCFYESHLFASAVKLRLNPQMALYGQAKTNLLVSVAAKCVAATKAVISAAQSNIALNPDAPTSGVPVS